MPTAVGLSHTLFSAKKIGNLCRGKEWWIEVDAAEREQVLSRTVLSGVELQDERARQARRGLQFSGKEIEEFIQAIANDQMLVACAEDSYVHDIPIQATGVEHYQMSKLGFAMNSWFARWELQCADSTSVREALDKGVDLFLLAPQNSSEKEQQQWLERHPAEYGTSASAPILSEQLKTDVHRLIGGRENRQAGARYVADAIWDVLESCSAIILLHEDKHSRCLGIYSKEEGNIAELVERFCQQYDILYVPFSIPPMLARWDRAIRDLRRDWNAEDRGEFPIPAYVRATDDEEISSEQESDIEQESEIIAPTNDAEE